MSHPWRQLLAPSRLWPLATLLAIGIIALAAVAALAVWSEALLAHQCSSTALLVFSAAAARTTLIATDLPLPG